MRARFGRSARGGVQGLSSGCGVVGPKNAATKQVDNPDSMNMLTRLWDLGCTRMRFVAMQASSLHESVYSAIPSVGRPPLQRSCLWQPQFLVICIPGSAEPPQHPESTFYIMRGAEICHTPALGNATAWVPVKVRCPGW